MELNKRLDQMEEELKLLKNEIKQVLLEIQEHVLTIENPFSVGISAASSPVGNRKKNETIYIEDARTQGASAPDDQVKPVVLEEPVDTSEKGEEQAQPSSAEGIESGTIDKLAPDEPLEPLRKPDIVTSKEDAQVEGDKGINNVNGDVKQSTESEEQMDLLTIIGLARWTKQVVEKFGTEKLDPLLELSEMRGNLPRGTKDLVQKLAVLVDGDSKKPELPARDMVLLLAQLDALSGVKVTQSDAKLIPVLMQGDLLEGLPLIRQ